MLFVPDLERSQTAVSDILLIGEAILSVLISCVRHTPERYRDLIKKSFWGLRFGYIGLLSQQGLPGAGSTARVCTPARHPRPPPLLHGRCQARLLDFLDYPSKFFSFGLRALTASKRPWGDLARSVPPCVAPGFSSTIELGCSGASQSIPC